uniref:Paraneoplastic antigen Ma-like N-terminal domain-containing protein n=1 Tax=Chelonoidis abingdonii TaxID=106734 RepID=A0A8C0J2A4_CHEAB
MIFGLLDSRNKGKGHEDWCKGMNIDPRNCLLVMGVPQAFNEGSVESVLRPEGAFAVLCELPLAVAPLQVPNDIAVEDGEWMLIPTVSQSSPAPASDVEFLKKMLAFLGKEGKTSGDMTELLGFDPGVPRLETAPSPDEWVKVLGQPLEKVVGGLDYFKSKLQKLSEACIPRTGKKNHRQEL